MKTLIEKSIKFRGIGRPDTVTVFNIENDEKPLSHLYKPLTAISGRLLTVMFDTEEEGALKPHTLQLSIPRTEDEETIKQFVLEQINTYLTR